MEILGVTFSAIFSVIFWGVVLITLVRIFTTTDEKPKRCKLLDLEIGRVFVFGLAVRLFVYIIGFFIMPADGDLFTAFRAWDSAHYINIAHYGYSWVEYVDGEPRNLLLVFFPLYGFLIRLFNPLVGDYWRAAYVISALVFSFGICFLYRLVKIDFNKKVAWWSVIFLSFAPPAFFFGTVMTESLMILTSSAALYFIRTHKWPAAGMAGALSMLTRMVGLVFVGVAMVEFISARKRNWLNAIFILLIPVGGLIYLYINWDVSGDPFRFMYYQRVHWHNATQYFGQTIIDQFNIIASDSNSQLARQTAVPNIITFVITIVLLAYACAKKMPATYVVYVLGYTFVSFAPAWLLSGPRYMVACVPLFIFLGHFAGKRPLCGTIILAASFAGMLAMMHVFLAGGFVF